MADIPQRPRPQRRRRAGAPASSVRSVCVIGLGRFGAALAAELMDIRVEVLGVDLAAEVVQDLDGALTKVVRADTTRPEVLDQLGIDDFDRVIVAIGDHLEASVLTTSLLLKREIPDLWAKASSAAHGQILEQLGVEHVVYPEHDMGRRVAHLVAGSMQDFVDYGAGLTMATVAVPEALLFKEVAPGRIQERFGVRILLLKKPGAGWIYPDPQTVIEPEDTLIVAGSPADTEAFANLP